MTTKDIPEILKENLFNGMVIPASPLALNDDKTFSEKHQRALMRYYIDAGAGGIAVGVHSTQFEIRDPHIGLFEPVLTIASETIDDYSKKTNREIFKVAGIVGKTQQAVQEAEFARKTGYHAGLLSLGALKDEETPALIAHCKEVAEEIPIIGFYLQPAVGGRTLPYEFWRQFAEIENVLAIKMAPFNRYQTLDVVRGVAEAGRENDIVLYTGNDDNIVVDLLTPYHITTSSGETKTIFIKGGLLGHWCVWIREAVTLLEKIKLIRDTHVPIPPQMLTRAIEETEINQAIFDPQHSFKGCISGIHEILFRQKLLPSTRCLNLDEQLSPGQKEEINRIYRIYPRLKNEDKFISTNIDRWQA